MKIIIFGLGSIGQTHARLLSESCEHNLFAFRSNRLNKPNQMGIKELYSWEEVKELSPDVAFIANPTFLHTETAINCAKLGINLFIEKPLSHSLENIDLLESICQQKKLTCYTAYCLRFHPLIKKIGELVKSKHIYHVRVACSSYLPQWRPNQDFKKGYSVSAEKGGGVMLDLSHEFDYIQYLFGKIESVKGIRARASNLTIDAEDLADLLLVLEEGIHVNLHLNFLSRLEERTIKVDFERGYLTGDLITGRMDYLYDGKTQSFKFDIRRDEYLKQQTRYFFDNLGNPSIMNNLEEAKGLLSKILQVENG